MPSKEITTEYGPVEILFIRTENNNIDPELWQLLINQVDAQSVALLDVVAVQKDADGAVTVLEIDEITPDAQIEALAHGFTTEADLIELADQIEPGEREIVVAFEHVWARSLANRLASAGGEVIDAVRIPAPIVNQSIAEAAEAVDASDSSETEGND